MQGKLYVLRKSEKHWTQEQMAEYLHLSVQSYRNKELGKTEFTANEMFSISQLFHKNIEDIFLPINVPKRNKEKK